jgi:hypothetical protein
MCLNGPPGNVQLLGDLFITAPLQQQIDNLSLARVQAY